MRTIGAEPPNLPALLAPWHDFSVVSGTAAETLVAPLFVAASIGASFYSEEGRPAFRAFVSPSVVHFSCAFALSLASLAPWSTGLCRATSKAALHSSASAILLSSGPP
ncbi:MAG: hypothetical protein ACREFP_05670 [Acetobacteraceae bacterium]